MFKVWSDLYSSQNGGDAMKNQNFDFKDLLTFGIFIIALLTFVFTFCKLYIEKTPLYFTE